MSRTLSTAEKAKSDARKARFRELARQISMLSDHQRADLSSRCLATTIEGKTLSHHNQCLIALQIPDATIVGGFRQWINAGRAVRKGEHGATIWVPTFKKSAPDATSPDGWEETRFVMGTIFDVSQTDEIESTVVCAA